MDHKIDKIDKNIAINKYSIEENVLEGNNSVWLVTLTPKTVWATNRHTLYFKYTNEYNDNINFYTTYLRINRQIKPSFQCNINYTSGNSNEVCLTNEAYFYISLNQKDRSGRFTELVSIRRADNKKTQNDSLILDKDQFITVQTNKLERNVEYEIIITKGLKGDFNTSTNDFVIKMKIGKEGIAPKPYIALFTANTASYSNNFKINYFGNNDDVKIGWKAYDIDKVIITLNKCDDGNNCFDAILKKHEFDKSTTISSQEYKYPQKLLLPC